MKRICKIIGAGLMALSLMPGAVLGQTTLRHSTPVRVMRGSPGIFSPWILRGLDLTAEQQAIIFDAFTRAGSENERGTGLGLTLSRQLARLLGGDLRLESQAGAGARFILEIARFLG